MKRLGLKSLVRLKLDPESHLRQAGWFRSVKTRLAVDGEDRPLPWNGTCLASPARGFKRNQEPGRGGKGELRVR